MKDLKSHALWLKITTTFVLFILPTTVWLLYKPVRILAPEFNGMNCFSTSICLEDTNRINQARLLYDHALAFVNSEAGKIRNKPRIIFCSTENCNQSFGFHAPAKAHTIGLSGIVIGPHGWNEYILRHELIHHLQAERLGIIRQWRSPSWFKEGMAYSFSQDTRLTLTKPLLDYKAKFESWFDMVGEENLWQEASKL